MKTRFLILIILVVSAYLVASYNPGDAVAPRERMQQTLPYLEDRKVSVVVYSTVSQLTREISAYNAGDINQCAGDPCISANGENICNALEAGLSRCAANFVKFGTTLEIVGWGRCVVVDRLNSRYPERVDIAMKVDEKQKALDFGLRRLSVKILKH